jgi:hypothetical protein
MGAFMAAYAAILFFVLVPGIFLRLPTGGSKAVVAATHAAVFGLLWYLTSKMVWRLSAAYGY